MKPKNFVFIVVLAVIFSSHDQLTAQYIDMPPEKHFMASVNIGIFFVIKKPHEFSLTWAATCDELISKDGWYEDIENAKQVILKAIVLQAALLTNQALWEKTKQDVYKKNIEPLERVKSRYLNFKFPKGKEIYFRRIFDTATEYYYKSENKP